MMSRIIMYFLCLSSIPMLSCSQVREVKDWFGGKVEKPGTYNYVIKKFKLDVTIEDGLVRYNLRDSLGNELLSTKDDVSKYQKWALFLDEEGSLWILSNDIGNAYWKWDVETQTYVYIRIDHLFDKSTIPQDVYSEVKDFF